MIFAQEMIGQREKEINYFHIAFYAIKHIVSLHKSPTNLLKLFGNRDQTKFPTVF